jgi:hypothetical protein
MKSLKEFSNNELTAPDKVMGGAPNVGEYDGGQIDPAESGVYPAYIWPAGTNPGDHPGGLPAYLSGDVLGDK